MYSFQCSLSLFIIALLAWKHFVQVFVFDEHGRDHGNEIAYVDENKYIVQRVGVRP